jgi:DNA uptake protein ComE-like DNA-binding protein
VATLPHAAQQLARRRALVIAFGLAAAAGVAWATPAAQASAESAKAAAVPIDINSASRAQLKTLPGIGDVEADRIISGRPYFSKADLATREVIPTGVYLSLKGRIIAKQKARPKVKAS